MRCTCKLDITTIQIFHPKRIICLCMTKKHMKPWVPSWFWVKLWTHVLFVFSLLLHLTQSMVSMTRRNACGGEMTENILKSCSQLLSPVMVCGCLQCLYGISVKEPTYHICLCLKTYTIVKESEIGDFTGKRNILMVIKNDEFENKSVFLDPCSVFSK